MIKDVAGNLTLHLRHY